MVFLSIEQIHTKPPAYLVKQVRERLGFTQVQCACLVGGKERAWQQYESGDRTMPLPTWWLFLLRSGEVAESDLPQMPDRQRAGVK